MIDIYGVECWCGCGVSFFCVCVLVFLLPFLFDSFSIGVWCPSMHVHTSTHAHAHTEKNQPGDSNFYLFTLSYTLVCGSIRCCCFLVGGNLRAIEVSFGTVRYVCNIKTFGSSTHVYMGCVYMGSVWHAVDGPTDGGRGRTERGGQRIRHGSTMDWFGG